MRARSVRWPGLALTALLACGAAGCASLSSSNSAVVPDGDAMSSTSSVPPSVPVITMPATTTFTAKAKAKAKATAAKATTATTPASEETQGAVHSSGITLPGAGSPLSDSRGTLLVDESRGQLASCNQTSSYSPTTPTVIGDGTVGTD